MTRSLLALTFAFSLSGCGLVSSDTSSGPENALTMQVNQAPPPDQGESQTTSPGTGYIWVAGYWDYLSGNYIWRAGRWVPEKPDYDYVQARYENTGHGWVFHRPHWKRRAGEASGAGPNGAT